MSPSTSQDPKTSFSTRLASYSGMSLAVAAAMTGKTAQAGIITSPIENLSTSSTGAVWFGFTPSTPASTNPAFSFGLYRNSFFGGGSFSTRIARFEWGTNSQAQVLRGSNGYALALGAGVLVGPGGNFANSAPIAFTSRGSSNSGGSSSSFSSSFGVRRALRHKQSPLGTPFYLGLELGGATPLFGWAQVQVDPNTFDITLIQFAYDDSGAPITTAGVPEPSTLALVALGAAGIAAYKRRRKTA